ncbi:hypothetical protein N7462_011426 [Penicillium macrosclerotiorum]|uniref:uncharacterized protein n=1 Tax=Penicillium macrosclerotiorum TaxID=303699 RepID=UPI0025489164|nr:uncharacterized protein N7462_011426 [Penicillium macrosclerotiorum]KAJ5664613.1 hypothetical protein N7462_011426 [Penicillium macrosclerotiorum]
MRMLTGDDGVDLWSTQEIWDTALRGMEVVFSTHAVLADALAHGFIQLQQLALLVFDEAHHCMKSHPGNQILQNFYHKLRLQNSEVIIPKILGLTASIEFKKIKELERNLNATCRVPVTYREELREHVPRRTLTKIEYSNNASNTKHKSVLLDRLENTVLMLARDESIPVELSKMLRKARVIQHQLGEWAASYFLSHVSRYAGSQVLQQENLPSNPQSVLRLSTLIAELMGSCQDAYGEQHTLDSVSSKVHTLLSLLKEKSRSEFSGIVFVRERVTAYLLSALVNDHPLTRSLFRCAPFVSNYARSEIWATHSSPDFNKKDDVITEFRTGQRNLLVATNVLEEGIDLPACHLVISFDTPDNIISYIQRRGRARQSASEFFILVADDAKPLASQHWDDLEIQMQNMLSNPQRRSSESGIERENSLKKVPRLELPTGFGALSFLLIQLLTPKTPH